ncbi:MAG: DUF2312 domain-containing protein [bacterium]|jgi:uncharacterized protein (UPF0335 family)
MSEIGHNSAGDQLKSVVDRVLKLMEERDVINEDIREIYAEAKANGYDVAVLRQIVSALRKDKQKQEEQAAVRATYCHAMGLPEWMA